MDFWDLSKLLVRHWRLALPVLLATLVLTVLTLVHVKPYYVSTAYVQLVSPVPVAVPVGELQPTRSNPWLTQSLSTLGNAALVTVQDLTYAHRLEAEGYSGKYTAQLGGSNPLAVFMVTGKTRQQARDSANVIVAQYEKNVADLQTVSGAAVADMIIGQRLDTGSNITTSSGRVKRDLLVVIAAGLMTATLVSLLADLLARRRAGPASEPPAPSTLAGGPGPSAAAVASAPVAHGSHVAEGSNVATRMAARPVTASARVPAANRATPPTAEHSVDWSGKVDQVAAGVPSGSGAASTMSSKARTGSGPIESRVVVDGRVANGAEPEFQATAAAGSAVADAMSAQDETIVIPKILHLRDK